jgi:hypothetical protein
MLLGTLGHRPYHFEDTVITAYCIPDLLGYKRRAV